MDEDVDIAELWRRQGIPEWEFRVSFGSTRIAYDPDKELINREKHGYSLESAAVFLEEIAFPFGGGKRPKMTSDGYFEAGEVRHMHMTSDDSGRVVLMVTTMRPNETVRVISYRLASVSEREEFFRETGYRQL